MTFKFNPVKNKNKQTNWPHTALVSFSISMAEIEETGTGD